MIVVAQLNKPYTNKARMDFIVEQNHRQGYEIRETETALEALGPDAEEQEQAKEKSRVAELKQYLADTDYCILKIEEAIDEAEKQDLREKYADVIKARREARIEINKLEK